MEHGSSTLDPLTIQPISRCLLHCSSGGRRCSVPRHGLGNECRSLISFVFPSSLRSRFATAPHTHRRAKQDETQHIALRFDQTSPDVSRCALCDVSCVWAVQVTTIHVLSLNWCGDPNYTASTKPRAPILTVPGAVGDNSTQTANMDSTTTSMSRKLDTMMEEPILQTVKFQATV